MNKKIAVSGMWYVQTVADQGPRGMLPFPAGEYESTKSYTSTVNVAPYVLFAGTYYVMNKVGVWLGTAIGKTPAQDYAANGVNATWIPFENYKAIYVELLMAKLGLIGSAVFYDEYLISQQGVDKYGNLSSDYKGFEDGTFIPNISLNFLTGEVSFGVGTFRGSIATVPVHITHENISKYVNVSTANGVTFWNIMIDKTGFNIQIDCDVESASSVINIELPRALKHEGVELNIVLAYNTRFQPDINGIATFKNNIMRVAVGLDRFVTYQFKCIVFDPPENYNYSLINGMALEWIQVM